MILQVMARLDCMGYWVQHTARRLVRVVTIGFFRGEIYQTEEIQKHDRRYDPSVEFAKQRFLFLWVDVDIILDSIMLLLVCRVGCVGRRLFHLEIHREEWVRSSGDSKGSKA